MTNATILVLAAGMSAAPGADDAVELTAVWEPIAESVYGTHTRYPQLQDLKPARSTAPYEASVFAPFLPPETAVVGETWKIDADAALPLLRQLHEGATTRLHHGFGASPGAWACLRAVDGDRAEVLFRVHAEFVLVPGDDLGSTSWLTPAQFEGRLVVDRVRGAVEHVRLHLPPRNGSNFDVNLPMNPDPEAAAGGRIIADIGFIPRMELFSDEEAPAIAYTEEIPIDDARLKLARRFYRFAEIEWRTLPEALAEAQTRGIPLHIVALFGALDDESC